MFLICLDFFNWWKNFIIALISIIKKDKTIEKLSNDIKEIFIETFILFFTNKIFVITSKIPIQPYYKSNILKEAVFLKMNFETIQNEVKNIYKDFKIIDNDLFFKNLDKSKSDWTRLYLKWFNKIDSNATNICPKTTNIIKTMPNIQTAMISVLKPNAKIEPHYGVYRGCIRLHMGLITPNSNNCFINLDGKSYSWRNGEVILLDDSYLHYVENNTNEYRVILLCDIIRPMNFVGNQINNFIINILSNITQREN